MLPFLEPSALLLLRPALDELSLTLLAREYFFLMRYERTSELLRVPCFRYSCLRELPVRDGPTPYVDFGTWIMFSD